MPDCSVCGEGYTRGRYYSKDGRLGHVDFSNEHQSLIRRRALGRLHAVKIRGCALCGGVYSGGEYASHHEEERHQLVIRGRDCPSCGGRYVAGTYGEHKRLEPHLLALARRRMGVAD